jgi:hypothetical protein
MNDIYIIFLVILLFVLLLYLVMSIFVLYNLYYKRYTTNLRYHHYLKKNIVIDYQINNNNSNVNRPISLFEAC